jgi:hypothetical protein
MKKPCEIEDDWWEEKNPPSDCSLKEGEGQNIMLRAVIEGKHNKGEVLRQVDINSRGTRLHGQPAMINRKVPSYIRKEGDIETISYKSRERFRSLLFLARFPLDFDAYDITFTIPGEWISPKDAKDLFAKFCKNLDRKKVCVIWRCEVQKSRDMLHFHMCAGVHHSENVYEIFLAGWHSAIDSLGEVVNYTSTNSQTKEKFLVPYASSRMALAGALERAVQIKPATIKSTFWRYLCDHMSKSKQDQIGHEIGRHWGVVNRKYLVIDKEINSKTYLMTEDQWKKFSRFLCRLVTPWFWDDKRKAYRRGFKPRINRYGKAIRFGHSESADRLAVFVGGRLVERGAGGIPPS